MTNSKANDSLGPVPKPQIIDSSKRAFLEGQGLARDALSMKNLMSQHNKAKNETQKAETKDSK